MRQPQVVDDSRKAGNDCCRCQMVIALDGVGEPRRVSPPLPSSDPSRVDRLNPIAFRSGDQPRDDLGRTLYIAGLQQVHHDLVVRHQHEAGLVNDGDVAQFFVRVSGRQDRYSGLIDGRPAHRCIQVAGGKGRWGRAAETGAKVPCMRERHGPSVAFRCHPPGKIQGRAGHVGVDVDSAGQDDQAARVDRAAALDFRDDAAIRDADVLDHAVDPVGRIVDLPTCYPEHTVAVLIVVVPPTQKIMPAKRLPPDGCDG